MRVRQLGPAGPSVPVLGIGTWNMERDDRKAAIAAIRRAIELGMIHVDTAELYGNGKVETLVDEAIAAAVAARLEATPRPVALAFHHDA